MLFHVDHPYLAHMHSFLTHHYTRLTTCIYKFDHFLEMMLLREGGRGDSDGYGNITFVTRTLLGDAVVGPPPVFNCTFLQAEYPGKFIDYFEARSHFVAAAADNGLEAPDVPPAVVLFPLVPKPHAVCSESWVSEHW